MTEKQKSEIIRMRENGVSFSKISEITRISRNTVKSFCRRKNISVKPVCAEDAVRNNQNCKQCKKPLSPTPGRKRPKFCSKECRTVWWNSHPEAVNRKAIYTFTCAGCGNVFTSYGNKGRKFCSHSCYIATRFGGIDNE